MASAVMHQQVHGHLPARQDAGTDVPNGRHHGQLRLRRGQHLAEDLDGVEVVLLAVPLQQVLHEAHQGCDARRQ